MTLALGIARARRIPVWKVEIQKEKEKMAGPMGIWANYICTGRTHGWTLHVRDIRPDRRMRILLRRRSNFSPLLPASLKCNARVNFHPFLHPLSSPSLLPVVVDKTSTEILIRSHLHRRSFYRDDPLQTVAESCQLTLGRSCQFHNLNSRGRSTRANTNEIDVPLKFAGTMPLSR